MGVDIADATPEQRLAIDEPLAVPDLATFRILPWAQKCGWVVSDLHLRSGERCPFDPRAVRQNACARLAQHGLTYVAGLEVECHIFKVTDPRAQWSRLLHPARDAPACRDLAADDAAGQSCRSCEERRM
jgi:glutamine synthetase